MNTNRVERRRATMADKSKADRAHESNPSIFTTFSRGVAVGGAVGAILGAAGGALLGVGVSIAGPGTAVGGVLGGAVATYLDRSRDQSNRE